MEITKKLQKLSLAALIVSLLPQMKLYCEIGKLVSGRPEKGSAIVAAEYLSSANPDITRLPPRNLRWMREPYCSYEAASKVLTQKPLSTSQISCAILRKTTPKWSLRALMRRRLR